MIDDLIRVLDGSDPIDLFGAVNLVMFHASWRLFGCTCKPLGIVTIVEDDKWILHPVHDEACPMAEWPTSRLPVEWRKS